MRKAIVALLPLALLALSPVAAAKQSKLMNTTQLKGTILRQKEVSLPNSDVRDLVVQIKTSDGRRIPADLGPSDRLKDLQLSIGSEITATGMVRRVGDRGVLFAERIILPGGTSFTVERPSGFGRQAGGPGMPGMRGGMQGMPGTHGMRGMPGMRGGPPSGLVGNEEKVSGRIIHLKTVSVQAPSQPSAGAGREPSMVSHEVVMLRTTSGQPVIVDLGPRNKLSRARLRIGSRISVQARPVRIGDDLVLLADTLTASGRTVHITQLRPSAAMKGGQTSQPSEEGGEGGEGGGG